MTRTAKLDQVSRCEPTWIKNRRFLTVPGLHGRNVFSSGAETPFAGDPWDHAVKLEGCAPYGGCRVAGKAQTRFSRTYLLAKGTFQRFRHASRVA